MTYVSLGEILAPSRVDVANLLLGEARARRTRAPDCGHRLRSSRKPSTEN